MQLGSLCGDEMNLRNLIPMTVEDSANAHTMGKRCPTEFFYLDMVYLNRAEQEFLVFYKEGEWKEEGTGRPLLSMKQRFN
jgi:hypothetical protein